MARLGLSAQKIAIAVTMPIAIATTLPVVYPQITEIIYINSNS
jgi:hypothetical protein